MIADNSQKPAPTKPKIPGTKAPENIGWAGAGLLRLFVGVRYGW